MNLRLVSMSSCFMRMQIDVDAMNVSECVGCDDLVDARHPPEAVARDGGMIFNLFLYIFITLEH